MSKVHVAWNKKIVLFSVNVFLTPYGRLEHPKSLKIARSQIIFDALSESMRIVTVAIKMAESIKIRQPHTDRQINTWELLVRGSIQSVSLLKVQLSHQWFVHILGRDQELLGLLVFVRIGGVLASLSIRARRKHAHHISHEYPLAWSAARLLSTRSRRVSSKCRSSPPFSALNMKLMVLGRSHLYSDLYSDHLYSMEVLMRSKLLPFFNNQHKK